MNNWNGLQAHYHRAHKAIHAEKRNEWGIDPYAWDETGFVQMTPIETNLWADIRQVDAVFYPQYPVGRFFVDFANPVAKVAIECDGAKWHDAEKDAERDRVIELMGWTVYRITGKDCNTDSDPETGKAGAARNFVLEIARKHGLIRGQA